MMVAMRSMILALATALLASCATSSQVSDLLGVRLDARKQSVRDTLAPKAKLEREEKRQEVWTLAHDPRYASLIVGYTPDGTVRFVTAVARPDGTPVRYAEVANLTAADHRAAGETHTYTWMHGARSVIAIGNADRVKYLSLKKGLVANEEEEDDDD